MTEDEMIFYSRRTLAGILETWKAKAFSPLSWKQKTRLQAEKAGLPTYFSKNPCPKGHFERYVSTNTCAPCQRLKSARNYKRGSFEQISTQ